MKEQLKQTEQIILKAMEDGRDTLFEHEVYQILSLFGAETPAYFFMTSKDQASSIDINSLKSNSKVVVKVISPDILHKTDAGGVLFVEPTVDGIANAFETIKKNIDKNRPNAKFVGVLVSEMVSYEKTFTNELIASFKQDRAFGPLVTFGQGGVHTEFFAKHMKEAHSVATRSTLNLDKAEIERMINQVAVSPAFYGKMRGQDEPIVDVAKIERLINLLKELADHFSPINTESSITLEEFELNPVLVTKDKRLVAVDGLVKFTKDKHKSYTKPVNKINNLLKPKSAMVIGASANKQNPGRIILQNLVNGGGVNKDNIFVVHNKADEIDGCKCVKTIQDIPQRVDIAVVTVPADRGAPEAITDLIKYKKCHSIILISSGFGETEAGKEKEKVMIQQIIDSRSDEDGGVLVNGGNCLGIVSLPGNYNTFFLPKYKLPFSDAKVTNVSAVSQSGAYLVTLASNFDTYINPRYTISFGNQIDVTVSDFLEYMKGDDEIDVVSTYVEGFKDYDGIKYLQQARELIDSGKVVLLYKAGRTDDGMKAAASHTASMVGDYASTLEVMKQAGVIAVDDLNMFEDYVVVFSFLSKKKKRGNRVGIISNAGFECTRAADSLYDMKLADFSNKAMDRIKEILPSDIVDIHNPIDATPTALTKHVIGSVEAMMEDDNVDCVLVSMVSATPALENMNYTDKTGKVIEDIKRPESFPNKIIELFHKYDKPMVVAVDSGDLYDEGVAMMKRNGVPVYRKIDRATRALSKFVNFG